VLVLMNARVFRGHAPGDMFDVPDDEFTQHLIERGVLTSMERWEDRARAEKIEDPWPE
jgi:hypothetical protein